MSVFRRARGMTLVGLLFILLLFVLVAGLTMKVLPAYTEHFTIEKMLKTMSTEEGFADKSAGDLRASFDKRAVTGYVTVIRGSDLRIEHGRGGNTVTAEYEYRTPLVANISLVINFFASTDPDAQPSPVE